jgi:hypothetical protein
MKQFVVLLEAIVAPLTGLATIADMLELVSLGVMPVEANTSRAFDSAHNETEEDNYDREWLLELMYRRILDLSKTMVSGIDHILLRLGDKSSMNCLDPDSEAQKSTATIGTAEFAKYFSQTFDDSQKLAGSEMTVNTLLDRFMEDQPRLCRTMTMDQSSEMLQYFIFSHVSVVYLREPSNKIPRCMHCFHSLAQSSNNFCCLSRRVNRSLTVSFFLVRRIHINGLLPYLIPAGTSRKTLFHAPEILTTLRLEAFTNVLVHRSST